jgi:hypothetical protein
MENKKLNWVLWVGLAIPVVVLLFVIILAYAPNGFTAKYDFVYSFRDYNYDYCNYNALYKVKDQKIYLDNGVLNQNPNCKNRADVDAPKIYRYDVVKNERTALTLADAQKLQIDNNVISPDGMFVQRGGYNNYGILEIFGGGNNYNSIYLKNDKGKLKKIDLGSLNSYRSYDFMFIGWVLK